jgi:hypothetical protein
MKIANTPNKKSKPKNIGRIIQPDFPRMTYKEPDPLCPPPTNFRYYRRQLIEEVEFLTLCVKSHKDKFTLLVIGAAPGFDLMFLIELFPEMMLILFDPKPILIKTPQKRVKVYQTLFTDEWAEKIKKKLGDSPVFMQCYTRIENYKLHTNLEYVRQWHSIILPERGAYEFTLPFSSDEITEFIKGEVYFPVWSKKAGAACRLITDQNTNETTGYENRRQEEQMMYFNIVVRPKVFQQMEKEGGMQGKQKKSMRYDELAEFTILQNYIRKFQLQGTPDMLSMCITRHLAQFPVLPDWFIQRRKQVLRGIQSSKGKFSICGGEGDVGR